MFDDIREEEVDKEELGKGMAVDTT